MKLVLDALEQCEGVKTCAAEMLGTSEASIRRRVKKLKDEQDQEHQIAKLEDQVKLLERQLGLARSKMFKDRDLEEFVREALGRKTEMPEWVAAAAAGQPDRTNVAVQILSDIHFPEVVEPKEVYGMNAYDARIAELRVQKFFEGSARITNEIFPTTPIVGTVQFWIGDMLSGNIHDELMQTNDFDLLEATLRLRDLLVAGVKRHLEMDANPMHIVCVPGNHGRLTKKPKAKGFNADTTDWLLYHLVAREFTDEPRVTFQVGTAPDHMVSILGWRFLVTHGNQARGGAGMIGAIGPIMRLDFKKRKLAIQTGNEYDYLVTGHFHTFVPNLMGVVINGSIVGYNEYATQNNLSFQPPQQGYFLVHPTRGITYSTPIFVEHEDEGWRDGEVRMVGIKNSIDISEVPEWLSSVMES
jgi:DNA-binding Lrp family transcriptional regulator